MCNTAIVCCFAFPITCLTQSDLWLLILSGWENQISATVLVSVCTQLHLTSLILLSVINKIYVSRAMCGYITWGWRTGQTFNSTILRWSSGFSASTNALQLAVALWLLKGNKCHRLYKILCWRVKYQFFSVLCKQAKWRYSQQEKSRNASQ